MMFSLGERAAGGVDEEPGPRMQPVGEEYSATDLQLLLALQRGLPVGWHVHEL